MNPLISDQILADQLCAAFEGGSNYWCFIYEFRKPTSYTYRVEPEGQLYRHIDFPMNPGGELVIVDVDDQNGEQWVLNRANLEQEFPKHFARILEEQSDADDADVLLQLALFGEVIYG